MSAKVHELRPEFVELVPGRLEPGVLYISVRYKSVQHSCCCGCGRKVVTPLSPTGWRITFDGRSVSIHPSIGNWQRECGSHYFIVENRVRWARRWSENEVSEGLRNDIHIKRDYYSEPSPSIGKEPASEVQRRRSWKAALQQAWRKVKGTFS